MYNAGVLVLAVYHLAQMSVTFLLVFVVLLPQYTPLDLATQWGRDAVVAYLKTAADPNMLGVSM